MPVLVKEGFTHFSREIYESKYALKDENGGVIENWAGTAARVANSVMAALGYQPNSPETTKIRRYIEERKFLPGGRYLYASGRDLHQVQNCLLLRAEDSREGWGSLTQKSAMALMTGAGIGVDYSDIRASGSTINKTGGVASGPIALMKIINEIGRNVMQGGNRRSAIWAGLNWAHGDIFDFINVKNWSKEVRAMKEKDFNFPAALDMTNVSVILDNHFFEAFHRDSHELHDWATKVYWQTVTQMVKTAEPGFSIDIGQNSGETLRNACTEVTSVDDSDICNLGSINLARVSTIEELKDLIDAGTLFLLAGTVYSHLPYAKVAEVRAKNRRLGLGLMGIHEWLLTRHKKYGPDPELGEWLKVYATSTEVAAKWAEQHHLSKPVKTRAIAPTGTIGIIAETTTGIEPIFCVAYKRRYRQARPNGNDVVKYQYVVDPTAKRLIDQGVEWREIEDAYSLAYRVEKRVEFQAWVQEFVDHGISSTINLPEPITDPIEVESFGFMLIKHLPKLRGLTCYPNGARGGQPLVPVLYAEAIKHEGLVFEENEETCVGGACGL